MDEKIIDKMFSVSADVEKEMSTYLNSLKRATDENLTAWTRIQSNSSAQQNDTENT